MASVVSLESLSGEEKGQDISFPERMICLMGRAEDCGVKLPSDESTRHISRYHCLLDVNPPNIRVRDFGSMNGTLVNGARIGKSTRGKPDSAGTTQRMIEHDLFDGDIVTLGDTSFRVRIRTIFECSECGVEIEEEPISSMPTEEGS